ncbi:MAG: methionine--tRNA ligase [Fimbriimonadaceae bacterium]|nr:methionine--tRNA ligase [Fimbriimonadaceae bacterium]
MAKRVTVCTAIPYVNSVPHIGNILTDLCGDITARYLRLQGEHVHFQVGTDENGLKIKEAAEAQGRDPHEFTAEIAQRFRDIFDAVAISYDDFVRTSEPRHQKVAHALFRKLESAGHIYKGIYAGWYDVTTETFYREDELVDGKSPDGNEVRWVEEENYFFRLSAFADRLRAHYDANPYFIRPVNRRNEVLAFLDEGLRDICITRKNTGWGITVPDRDDLVIYVWFDAVMNYVTTCGYPDDPEFGDHWPARVIWIGKDILTRFHATLWPAMLMAAELPLFDTIAAHGWVLLSHEKMSKSKGNVVRPLELAEKVAGITGIPHELAVDTVRHYLSATMSMETDSSFSYADFYQRYNTDLANDLGNAVNRSLSIAHRVGFSTMPDAEIEPDAQTAIEAAKQAVENAMAEYQIPRASEAAFGLIRFLGKYIDRRAPWALAKSEDPSLGAVVASMLRVLRAAEGLIRPLLPHAADAVRAQLGLTGTSTWSEIGQPSEFPVGTLLPQPTPIFPRIDLKAMEAENASETAATATAAPATAAPGTGAVEAKPKPTKPDAAATPAEITIDDFAKVQFRVARVIEAEPVEGADKLYKLQVAIGEERRQIVSGIRKNYTVEDLIGRQIVVVTNLKAAKLRGVESQGMLLAATDAEGGAILLQPDKEAPEGAPVK